MQANFTAKQRCSLTPAVRHPAITTVKMRKYYLISWNGLFTTHENGLIFFFFYKAHTVNGMVSIYVASRGQEHTSNCCHSSCYTEIARPLMEVMRCSKQAACFPCTLLMFISALSSLLCTWWWSQNYHQNLSHSASVFFPLLCLLMNCQKRQNSEPQVSIRRE